MNQEISLSPSHIKTIGSQTLILISNKERQLCNLMFAQYCKEGSTTSLQEITWDAVAV
ncbi:hypothetical protein BgiBS90_026713, partial [Biomphalaria glabrata]